MTTDDPQDATWTPGERVRYLPVHPDQLPIANMIAEATRAWGRVERDPDNPILDVDRDSFGNLACHVLALAAEVHQLRHWIDDLHSGMYINCVYCGHRYGPEDEVAPSMADALKEHCERCPKHPMSALKAEVERLMAERIDLRNEYQDRCDRYLDQAERFKAERDAALRTSLALAEACRQITSIVADPNDGRDQYGSALARARMIARAALAAFEARGSAVPATEEAPP